MAGKPKYKIGSKWGYLTIIEDTGKRNKGGNVIWVCQCKCGKKVIRASDSLYECKYHKLNSSCGCMISKAIGKREADNPIRKEKAREGLGQIDGTTMQGIDRKTMNKNNKSGVRGVHWASRQKKWRACLELRGVQYRKDFDNKEDAIKYRKYLEEKYFEPIKERYKEMKKDEDKQS